MVNSTIPPVISGYSPTAPPEETFVPVEGFGALVDSLLRNPRRVVWQIRYHDARPIFARLGSASLAGALCYGLVIGSFARGDQFWIAPVKVAGGLLASALICLPSLYVFATVNGARARFSDVAGLACGFIALAVLLLIGFAPVAWIFSASTESADLVGGLHIAFWLVCVGFGYRFLRAGLLLFDLRPGPGLGLWAAIFVLVSLQMTCALRPIVGGGEPFLPATKLFFLDYWLGLLSAK
jgi:hypothetical protein